MEDRGTLYLVSLRIEFSVCLCNRPSGYGPDGVRLIGLSAFSLLRRSASSQSGSFIVLPEIEKNINLGLLYRGPSCMTLGLSLIVDPALATGLAEHRSADVFDRVGYDSVDCLSQRIDSDDDLSRTASHL